MRREENRRILIKKYKQRNIRIEQQTINEQSSKGAKDEVVRSCCKVKHDIPTKQTLIRGITGRRKRGRPRLKGIQMVENT
jgi:hypothetical protein